MTTTGILLSIGIIIICQLEMCAYIIKIKALKENLF